MTDSFPTSTAFAFASASASTVTSNVFATPAPTRFDEVICVAVGICVAAVAVAAAVATGAELIGICVVMIDRFKWLIEYKSVAAVAIVVG